jgi:repressor LexA
MPFDIKEFGRRLRVAREKDNLTQEELAARIRANRSWISGLETGQQSALRAETVVRLAEALGCTADYLLGLTDQPARPAASPRRKKPAPADADTEEAA